ncbi:aromatase/cyclase [Kitasatospora sp. NPDC057223]|uniref:aromatase/cyclase n=1 Tax=Kitasatospora sp. NPDC057223 TaxID=3346055 RepID=UPI0036304153
MNHPVIRDVRHTIDIAAQPRLVHRLLADAVQWPELFPPTVHVERTALDGGREQLRIWALAGEEVRAWTSERRILPAELAIDFVQQQSAAPVAAMSGRWEIGELPDGGSRVVLTHRFSAVGDDPASLAWIEEATDRNSGTELAALRSAAERHREGSALRHSFEDSVVIRASAQEIYDYLYRADLWPQRLPHVARVELTESRPGRQLLEMDTRSPDGSAHTTRSVRIGLTPHTLVYKQTLLPAAFTAHTGRWTLAPEPGAGPGATRATSHHTVVLDPEQILGLPGVDSLQQGHDVVRHALGTNSLTTLRAAKAHLEKAASLA